MIIFGRSIPGKFLIVGVVTFLLSVGLLFLLGKDGSEGKVIAEEREKHTDLLETSGLLSGLHLGSGFDSGGNLFQGSDEVGAIEERFVDPDSLVYWSIGKQGGDGHAGTIPVKGRFLIDEGTKNVVIGRSHLTFLMDEFTVDNIPNSGIQKLFLDELLSKKFLSTDDYPFAQFVIVDVQSLTEETRSVYGRLKIKDIIDTIEMEEVEMYWSGKDTLLLSGSLVFSRYVWGLDMMPEVIDEFVHIDFSLGLSPR